MNGLVLSGGRSSRMGQDKGALIVPGVSPLPLREYVAMQMAPFCDQIFHSVRTPIPGLDCLLDETPDQGPLGGIISAARAHSATQWLIVACDFPLLTSETFSFLIANSNEPVKVFKNAEGFLEPLLGVWSAEALAEATKRFASGERSPSAVLRSLHVQGITPPIARWLLNINTLEDLAKV